MRPGDLVMWAHNDHARGLVGLVIAEPWCEEHYEGHTQIVTRVLFSKHPFEEPEEVDVDDVEVISEGR